MNIISYEQTLWGLFILNFQEDSHHYSKSNYFFFKVSLAIIEH